MDRKSCFCPEEFECLNRTPLYYPFCRASWGCFLWLERPTLIKAVHHIQPVLVRVPQPFVRNITILDMHEPRNGQLDALRLDKIRPITIVARMDWNKCERRLHKA
jgi:hypothetical protein